MWAAVGYYKWHKHVDVGLYMQEVRMSIDHSHCIDLTCVGETNETHIAACSESAMNF